MPYTDQITAGYERQLAGNMSVSADYVHAFSRDLLMSKELNPTLRATPVVATSPNIRQGSDILRLATAELQATYPGFVPFTTGVTIPVNLGRTDYDAVLLALEKRYSNNYSVRVSYTWAHSTGNTSGNGVPASGFQVLDDMNLDLNEGVTAQDHPEQPRRQRHGPRAAHRRADCQLGRARLERFPFSLTNGTLDPDLNGSLSEPLPAGNVFGHRR